MELRSVSTSEFYRGRDGFDGYKRFTLHRELNIIELKKSFSFYKYLIAFLKKKKIDFLSH